MKRSAILLLSVFTCCLLTSQQMFAEDLPGSGKNSVLEIQYPLSNNIEGAKIRLTNQLSQENQILIPPFSQVSVSAGKYTIEEIQAPDGYVANANPVRNIVVEDEDTKTIKFYNSKITDQEVPLYYINKTSGGHFLVDADYTGVKIGEYYWTNTNFNHVEPAWTWWTAQIGEQTLYPLGQDQLNKYLDQVRLDKNYFQVDTTLFHKYYGRHYDNSTVNYMRSYAKMLEGTEREETGWDIPYVKDFRQLFAMSPFVIDNNNHFLSEHDVRFALSAKYGDNPMTEISVPGECGTTYWFNEWNTNMYGFNMMPGGARVNAVPEGQYTPWYTNLCGTNVAFWASTGDIYHLFYTAKFLAADGNAGLSDFVETSYGTSYHWYNLRYCRRLTDAELGYKLYVKSDDTNIMESEAWQQFIAGYENSLLQKVRSKDFSAESFDIIMTEYSPFDDVAVPEGYKELPNGYVRGFYVQHILNKETSPLRAEKENVEVKDVFSFASNVADPSLGGVPQSPTGVADEESINRLEDVSIYPNPVEDILTIDCAEPIVSVQLYKLSGSLVKSEYSEGNVMNLSGLPSGMYILNIETETKSVSKKVFKK